MTEPNINNSSFSVLKLASINNFGTSIPHHEEKETGCSPYPWAHSTPDKTIIP